MEPVNPDPNIYKQLDEAVAYFNQTLFGNELPKVLIRLQRHLGSSGYFFQSRWLNREGQAVHQISLNPYFFAKRPLQEIFQTLVHQMCHLWQAEYGTPSRSGYHNLEWSRKMQSIGLMPTSTGQPGGKRVGQHLLDYAEPEGAFRGACLTYLSEGGRWTWLDRECEQLPDDPQPIDSKDPAALLDTPLHVLFHEFSPAPGQDAQKLKTKYECPGCGSVVWGKSGLAVACSKCQLSYVSRQKNASHRPDAGTA